jgi:hypothetical protein
MLTCPSCGSNDITLVGLNWQCNACKSFACGNIWDDNTISYNAKDLSVSTETYTNESLKQGNDLTKVLDELNVHKNKLRALGYDD